MVKNKTGGSKHKKRKKGSGVEIERELIFKEDCQEYAQAVRMLGNCKLECQCFDGITRLGHIRGKIKKKARIITGDIILLSLRDFEDGKADVIHVYNIKEVRNLKSYGEIPENVKINECDVAGDNEDEFGDIGFVFGEKGSEDEDDEEKKLETIYDIFDSI